MRDKVLPDFQVDTSKLYMAAEEWEPTRKKTVIYATVAFPNAFLEDTRPSRKWSKSANSFIIHSFHDLTDIIYQTIPR
jgi:hypothetical protein